MNLIYRPSFLIRIILQQSNEWVHLLDSIICFEHIQILTQLLWHLTTNHQLDGRCVSLYILIFNILNNKEVFDN
jgi:hypothetical protein